MGSGVYERDAKEERRKSLKCRTKGKRGKGEKREERGRARKEDTRLKGGE